MRLIPARAVLALLAAIAAGAGSPPRLSAAERERKPEALIEECRSPDLFFRRRAEGGLRRRGPEALPAIAAALEDPDRDLRLRLLVLFRDMLRSSLNDFDTDSLALLRDTRERDALKGLGTSLPQAIEKLRAETTRRTPR